MKNGPAKKIDLDTPMLDTAALGRLLGFCPQYICRLEKAGKLPAAQRIGGTGRQSRLRWLRSDIEAWLQSRSA
jgi:predicted DNA-binding transcriptional regulator AlpA